MAVGVERGWLVPSDDYVPAIRAGWAALTQRVSLQNGTVSGVCMGTGIEADASGYNGRGTAWSDSTPGGMAVILRAAAAVERLNAALERREKM
jgi:hypothetical protein